MTSAIFIGEGEGEQHFSPEYWMKRRDYWANASVRFREMARRRNLPKGKSKHLMRCADTYERSALGYSMLLSGEARYVEDHVEIVKGL